MDIWTSPSPAPSGHHRTPGANGVGSGAFKARLRLGRAPVIGLAAAAIAAAIGLGTAPAASAANNNVVVLNDQGGLTSADGLRIKVGPGYYSIVRNNVQQTYSPSGGGWDPKNPGLNKAGKPWNTSTEAPYNGIILTTGAKAICWKGYFPTECDVIKGIGKSTLTLDVWDTAETTLTDGVGPTYQARTVLTRSINGKLYTLTVLTDYIAPDNYATVSYSLDVPDGANDGPLAIYHGIDMELDGSDYGPAKVFTEDLRRAVVQVTTAGTAVGGFREVTGTSFGSYTAAHYTCLFGSSSTDTTKCPPNGGAYGPYNGSDYPNQITASTTTDIGVGVAWKLGDAASLALANTTVTKRAELFFADPRARLTGSFSSSTATPGSAVTLTYAIKQGVSGLPVNYADLDFTLSLPTGASPAGAPTTTCGGTVAENAGVLSLTNGALADTSSSCTVTLPVTFATAGAYDLTNSQVTASNADGKPLVLALTGTLTVTVPPAPPAPNNGGQSRPEPTPSVMVTPTPTPTPTPAPTATVDPLDPIGTQQNPLIPAGGLVPGASLLLVNGQPAPVSVAPNARNNPTGLDVSGDGWKMRLVGRGDDGDPLGLTEKQVLILQSDVIERSGLRAYTKKVNPVAQASGDGFKAVSPVKFYLLDNGMYLGQLTTDAAGVFSGKIPVPAGIKPGPYTLQMNGLAPNDAVRSLNIGVIVKPTTVKEKVFRAGTKVYFASMDPHLDAEAKSTLRALVKKTGKAGVRVAVTGYVQPTSVSSNDHSLSTARAKNVAAFLRGLGLKGAYVVRGGGKAEQTGATARRVNVTVTYTK